LTLENPKSLLLQIFLFGKFTVSLEFFIPNILSKVFENLRKKIKPRERIFDFKNIKIFNSFPAL